MYDIVALSSGIFASLKNITKSDRTLNGEFRLTNKFKLLCYKAQPKRTNHAGYSKHLLA